MQKVIFERDFLEYFIILLQQNIKQSPYKYMCMVIQRNPLPNLSSFRLLQFYSNCMFYTWQISRPQNVEIFGRTGWVQISLNSIVIYEVICIIKLYNY